ncbi:MAG: dual specificity protein phosphatase family protein, partial [Acidimicrobiales bacterium]|nr:dual specificity protein phosphatase family protein [Acidimicrobiales bacterium]
MFGSFVPLEYKSSVFGITGHLHIGSLIAVDIATKSHDQDGFDFFCDCRGEMCDRDKKPFAYRRKLKTGTKYHNIVVNRLNVKTKGNTFAFDGEFECTMTAVIEDMARSKKALVHCIHGASRSAFLALLFMVGMCPNLTVESAVDFLRAVRPCLDVNARPGHADIDEAVQYYMRRFKALCDKIGLTGTLADPVDFVEAKMEIQECVKKNPPSLVGDPQPPSSSAPAPKPRPTRKPSGASGSSASSGSAATNNCVRAQDGRAPVAPVTDPKP